jgi:hypothetical protein
MSVSVAPKMRRLCRKRAAHRGRGCAEPAPLSGVLPNYLSRTDTQGLDTRRPVQKPQQAVQKGQTFHPPTPAVIPPSHPESAKTDSSPMDAPFRGQGRSKRPKIVLPSSLVYGIQRMTRMSPPLRAFFQFPQYLFKGSLVDPRLRASNEHILIVRVPRAGGRPGYPFHLLRPRVARAQGTHWAIPPCWRTLSTAC